MTHIENLKLRQEKEYATINPENSKVLNAFACQKRPISEIELAMMLGVSAPLARKAIAPLDKQNLIIRDYKGNWRYNSQNEILNLVEKENLSDIAIANETKLEVELVRFELNEMVRSGLIQSRQAKNQGDLSSSQLVYEVASNGRD